MKLIGEVLKGDFIYITNVGRTDSEYFDVWHVEDVLESDVDSVFVCNPVAIKKDIRVIDKSISYNYYVPKNYPYAIYKRQHSSINKDREVFSKVAYTITTDEQLYIESQKKQCLSKIKSLKERKARIEAEILELEENYKIQFENG